MAEVLLVRHAKSLANDGDFAAFNNVESPLSEKGIAQIPGLRTSFIEEHGIVPEEYPDPVLASGFVRPYETAWRTGFREIHRDNIINEPDVIALKLGAGQAVLRHVRERWAPPQTVDQVCTFIERYRIGDLPYRICFGHALFIGTLLVELEREAGQQGKPFPFVFDAKHGFMPNFATITKIEI